MKTPIFDFVREYAESGVSRFHMPGHKGKSYLGIEKYDITEISGADVLYSASGIIEESENNATSLFKTAHTYYSTEGSTLAIKAMLALAVGDRVHRAQPTVLAARNVHKAFVNAAALLDISVEWLYPVSASHLCECEITPDAVAAAINKMPEIPCAVYITSPDYLGNIADIKGIAAVSDSFNIPLLVDNAHGAYLAYLTPAKHPIALGAAMCADSAHKTLPALTGGAYLHISKKYAHLCESARSALSVFASTSPSYLTLASLDLCNRYISDGYPERLAECIKKVDAIKHKHRLNKSAEPLKIVVNAPIAEALRERGIECEFSDDEYTVLMVTPENTDGDLERLDAALTEILRVTEKTKKEAISLPIAKRAISIRKAIFSPHELVDTSNSVGRILGTPTVSCPPAIPIAVSGEVITDEHVALFKRYGIKTVEVVK